MPAIGCGSHDFWTKDALVRAIMEAGYRHIDTASSYENEHIIGEALKECFEKGIKREEIFITTKLWHTEYNDIEGAAKRSMEKLGINYIDLYLIHWPLGFFVEPRKPVHVLWPEMEALVDKGIVKSIGISNFTTQMVLNLLCYCRIKPVANQIELNPQCVQWETVRFLQMEKINILPIAYTPVARPGAVEKGDALVPKDWPDLRNNQYLQSLAAKYKKSVPQIMLNWGLCRGYAVIPKAATLKYQLENLDIYDFRLTEQEILKVGELDGGVRLCNKFPFMDGFDVFH